MLFISVPIAVALGIGSVLALVLCSHMPLLLLPQKMFNGINTFTYMAIPLFMLAGAVMAEAKISDRLVILLIMGTFLDNVAALVIFVPTMMGVVHTLNIDDIYFGVFTDKRAGSPSIYWREECEQKIVKMM